MSGFKRARLASGVALGVLAIAVEGPGTALAQQAPPKAQDMMPEVVVTAEKHRSTVQATPISLTALSGDQLEARGTADIQQIVREVPGISMRSAGPGQTELEMRGLASSGGSSPTVGYYLDEVPLSPAPGALNGKVVIDPDLFDLDHVEVLRGPQGTLYGSGSMGGTIRMVTAPPNLEKINGTFEGIFSGTPDGGGVNGGINVMVNAPIIKDKVGVRLVATDKYTSGWIDRITLGNFPLPTNPGCWGGYGCVRGNLSGLPVTNVQHQSNWERQKAVRAELLIKPTDELSINTLVMLQTIGQGGYSMYDQDPGNVSAHYQPANISEPISDVIKIGSTTIKYDFGSFELTAATSYWWREEKQTEDNTEQIQNEMTYLTGGASLPFIPITYTEWDYSRQLSEEIRLASNGESDFNWLLGGFYSTLHSLYAAQNQNPAFAGYSYVPSTSSESTPYNPAGIIFNARTPYRLNQFAAFGEASYRFTETLKATVGLRWFRYTSKEALFENGIGALGDATPYILNVTGSSSDFTPRFNLSWEPTKDLTVYATASEGFRPGGVNLPGPPNVCGQQPVTYGPDKVWDYEIGEKAKLFDHKLSLNADFFYLIWDGVQQQVVPLCGYSYTTNAGTAESYGPEIEMTAHVADGLTVSATGTYTNAKLTSTDPTTGIAPGTAILNIPKYTGNLTIDYERPAFGDFIGSARLSASYVGSVTDVAFYKQNLTPYTLVDLRLGLSNDQMSLYFFCNNLTNRRAALTVNNTSFDWVVPSIVRVSTNQPRTMGLDFIYHF